MADITGIVMMEHASAAITPYRVMLTSSYWLIMDRSSPVFPDEEEEDRGGLGEGLGGRFLKAILSSRLTSRGNCTRDARVTIRCYRNIYATTQSEARFMNG